MCDTNIGQKILDELSAIRRQLESYENNNHHIDQYYQLSINAPLTLDYKNRKYLYAWVATTTVCTATIGTISLTANAWTNISLGESSLLIPPAGNPVQVLVRATNEKLV